MGSSAKFRVDAGFDDVADTSFWLGEDGVASALTCALWVAIFVKVRHGAVRDRNVCEQVASLGSGCEGALTRRRSERMVAAIFSRIGLPSGCVDELEAYQHERRADGLMIWC
jgi:hypothetical protein